MKDEWREDPMKGVLGSCDGDDFTREIVVQLSFEEAALGTTQQVVNVKVKLRSVGI